MGDSDGTQAFRGSLFANGLPCSPLQSGHNPDHPLYFLYRKPDGLKSKIPAGKRVPRSTRRESSARISVIWRTRWKSGKQTPIKMMQLLAKLPVAQKKYPPWCSSKAEALLKADVDQEKHKSMAPKDLYETNNEYKKFPLVVFRNHIHQETRGRLERAYWLVKKEEKKEKQRQKYLKKEDN